MITTSKRVLACVTAFLVACSLCLVMDSSAAQAKSARYWLKVNKKTCVVTAYKMTKKKWKPVRAMRCSVGRFFTPTPSGNFHVSSKWRWLNMKGCWGQYVSQFYGDYLFHSVWYYGPSKSRQNITEFNKLGRPASHGCVRLATIDSIWIYKNCKPGTKVTVFKGSAKKDPLGKPKKISSSSGWDPTDPTKGNPNFKLRRAVIKVKNTNIEYGSKADLKGRATAKNPNANENVSSSIKVLWVKKAGKKVPISTKNLGAKYVVKYKAGTSYCRKGYKKATFRIVDTSMPVIAGVKTETQNIVPGSYNLMSGVKGYYSRSKKGLTGQIKVTVQKEGAKAVTLSASQATAYKMTAGSYSVTYKVTNPYNKKKAMRILATFQVAAE